MVEKRVRSEHDGRNSTRIEREVVHQGQHRCPSTDHQRDFDSTLFDESWSRTWDVNRLTLMTKSPTSLYAYWEIRHDWQVLIAEHFEQEWDAVSLSLRLHDVTDLVFDGHHSHRQLTVTPAKTADNWYFHDVESNRDFMADLGLWTAHSQFFCILRSNRVSTPRLRCDNDIEICFAKLGSKTNLGVRRFSNPLVLHSQWTDGASMDASVATRVQVEVGVPPYSHQFDGYTVIDSVASPNAKGEW